MTTRIILPLLLAAFPLRVIAQGSGIATDLPAPVSVYCNWASYDELSDTVLLSEALALRELDEILRLRQQGVRFDYYLMDAFWFAPDGAYRAWKKPAWPQGPDRWLEACKANNLIPGLWFATNRHIRKGLLTAAPEWANSLATNNESYCLFEGDFLAHLMESFQMYADKGVRLFKLDFANFGAATEEGRKKYTREQIIEKNQQAFKQAIRDFRAKNPDVIIIAYNGFGGYINNTITPFPATADLRWRWLETCETL
ncbi:MAG: hypothetical protein LBI96_00285, partial [Odoribacteraceae bacterium]|nr:hypothetical protein [Odoribacteraceae bacterium]